MTEPSSQYRERTERNIGILTQADQETLRQSKVAVMGMGGIGSPCFEILLRTGVQRFSIVDKDRFDVSNLNRQIFAFQSTVGQKKVDAAKRFALDIAPDAEIETFEYVDESNIGDILSGAKVVIQAIDQLKPCIVTARKARSLSIPLVEGWALPYGNVRVLTHETPSLEEVYGLPTVGREISDISDDEFTALGFKIFRDFADIDGIVDFYQPDVEQRILSGRIPSFAPTVWFTSVLLALECLKILLGLGDIAYGPALSLYDPFYRKLR